MHVILALLLVFASACSKKAEPGQESATNSATADTADTESPPTSETDRLNQFFTRIFWRTVRRSPLAQGYLGFDFDKDKWDDISEKRMAEEVEFAKQDLAEMRKDFDLAKLDEQGKLSYELFEKRLQEAIDDWQWRHHSYPVNQMFGMHSQIPAFLGNFHKIADTGDAEAYIARLRALPTLLKQLEESMELKEKNGVLPPRFVFPMVIDDCRNIIAGVPFDESGEDSAIWADFKKKVAEAKLEEREKLEAAARDALLTAVKPGYESLIATLERQEKAATTDDGVWKLPRGDEFYARRLHISTTTDMSAEDIHQLGLREVERIHGEMREIMKKVGFKGELKDFFQFMRTDKQFYYPNTDEGRDAYQAEATKLIADMKGKLDELFLTKPKADIVVKRVEPYREKSAGVAFYNGPALVGDRPGIYYINLFDMAALPKYEMEALAFHEGIPGHHMQNAIAMEREGLPMFRRFLGYTAYGEGWGLYTERLAKEVGFYQDPYSDFGRLSMELWRACRLVLDTGIHHKKWTREQGIEWLGDNTPGSDLDVRKAVERYIVSPGQATAYTVGMLEIVRLRAYAKEKLGERFDIRAFHDLVLTNGPVPLPILAREVERWIARQDKGQPASRPDGQPAGQKTGQVPGQPAAPATAGS